MKEANVRPVAATRKKVSFTSSYDLNKKGTLTKNIHFDHLHTVCEESRCPNQRECSQNGAAAFLIGGNICTRNCRFCGVQTGRPLLNTGEEEVIALLNAVENLKLDHVVITSVTRDDNEYFLASHYAQIISELNKIGKTIEVLIPDFHAKPEFLKYILDAHPDIIAHNIETTKSLSPTIRPQADHERSSKVLNWFMNHRKENFFIKSGFMLGLGESLIDIYSEIENLKKNGVDVLTIGQYFPPYKNSYPVKKMYTENEFITIREFAESLSFESIEISPFARSSYLAASMVKDLEKNK